MSTNKQNGNIATVENPFGAAVPSAYPSNASTAIASQREVAEVQAAMIVAKRFPRDPIAAMDRILNACTRTSLAEHAIYQYGRGGQDVTGPSIRLAEELARQWGNISCGVTELSRVNGVSECLAWAWDLETNFRDEKRFQVKHWRDTKKGGYAITDERDIYELIANMGARRKRACILAVIPGDVQEAAVNQCEITLRTRAEVTPERVSSMIEKFAEFGVTKDMIETRIQRRMDAITPALLVNLGKIYNSLRDGMSAVSDWFEVTSEEPETPSKTEAVKDKLRSRKAKTEPKPETKAEEPESDPKQGSEPEPKQEEGPEGEDQETAQETEGEPGLFGEEG